jgi:tetratricopeptide (TPR) repeat protein
MTQIGPPAGAHRSGVRSGAFVPSAMASARTSRLPLRASRAPFLLAMAAAAAIAACAPAVPPALPGPPRYPDFLFPFIPSELQGLGEPVRRQHEVGWAYLQAGDLRNADRQFSGLVKRRPTFYPGVTGSGYVELARRDFRAALEWFDRVVGRTPAYPPALVGRGEALLGLGRAPEALDALEAALAADGSLEDVRRRVEVLRFRGAEDALAAARSAARAGRLDQARAAYERAVAASPQSGFLHRELAVVARALGDVDSALDHIRQAIVIDPGDGVSHLLLAEMLEEREAWDEAIAAYERARSLEAAPDLAPRIERLRERDALGRLPEAYRLIPEAARLTRGDLAALLGVRLEDLVRHARRREAVLVTDVRGHWAQAWIASVTRAGLMEVYSNHTFQPGATVRRSDLAEAASRLLAVIAAIDPALARSWQGARGRFSDIGPGHLSYLAASAAVAAGVMRPAGDAFQPSRPVTGAEAVEVVTGLERLAARAGRQGVPPR